MHIKNEYLKKKKNKFVKKHYAFPNYTNSNLQPERMNIEFLIYFAE